MQVLESQASLWQQFQTIHEKQRLAHAFLLIGAQHAEPLNFAHRMAATILCSQLLQNPCGECKSCRLLNSKKHPDFFYLHPDKAGGAIKIDQIRELHTLVFTSPQLGKHRIVIINPADKMNTAAANALLKLLEEPPSSLIFILIAENLSAMPATVISRCQQWRFSFAEILESDYLSIGESYPSDSERGKIIAQLPFILQDLIELLENKQSICSLASKWSAYELSDLLWFIYLINSQMISYQLLGRRHEKNWTTQLYSLAERFKLVFLFKQINQINEITKKLNKNINMNQTLVLENLLLGYVTACS